MSETLSEDIRSPNVPEHVQREHDTFARQLVEETHANDGLAPLDIERFWANQDVAKQDPFGKHIPQTALGIMMSGECVPTELGVEVDVWRYQNEPDYRLPLNKAYNDKAEAIVGRRLLRETAPPQNQKQFPKVKRLEDLFEGKQVWQAGSWWLEPAADDEDELKALLDRVEARLEDMRAFMLPPGWETERDKLLSEGVPPPLYRDQRGPVTFAMSIYGIEKLVFLLYDNPDLARRFSELILRSMLAIGAVLDEEAGNEVGTPRGFGFRDDNCSLLTPDMYEMFGYPILKGVFDRYAPDPEDVRFQHSDSAMEHLLPILGRLDLTGTNFGPTVMADDIRKHLPNAVIRGELAPFTFSRNDEEGIVREFLRDHYLTRDTRGLMFATAGSINDGSRLTGMRLVMAAIQRYGRFDT